MVKSLLALNQSISDATPPLAQVIESTRFSTEALVWRWLFASDESRERRIHPTVRLKPCSRYTDGFEEMSWSW
jgi:hypothetical protein